MTIKAVRNQDVKYYLETGWVKMDEFVQDGVSYTNMRFIGKSVADGEYAHDKSADMVYWA